MARVDSLLSILVDQGGNELRLQSDREPKMLAYGSPTRLSMPKMNSETVRSFLEELLTEDVNATLATAGRAEITYDGHALGSFSVTLVRDAHDAITATFLRASTRSTVKTADAPAIAQVQPIAPTTPHETNAAPRAPAIVFPREAPLALQALVGQAASVRASDIHLADGDRAFVRIDGKLHALSGMSETVNDIVGVDFRAAGHHAIEVAYDVPQFGRVRVHAYTAETGAVCAIRLLPPTAPSFESLQMPVAFDDVVMLPHGLVIVCGATGSGKSTTLAALVQEAMRKRSIVVVTLEDPIEFMLTAPEQSIVRRRQIGRDVADFASGLRDALREDPDVLLVGEMRDPETIALAITAAETGHLVFASLHSRGAASAIERIVDAYPPDEGASIRVQLAESLRAIIGQRLVTRARGSGRIPAVEVLRVNHAVASLIREGRTAQISTAIQAGRREGMIALERSLADRVRAQEITLEDARAAANDPEALALYLTDSKTVA